MTTQHAAWRRFARTIAFAGVCLAVASSAQAVACDRADALGTSRTLVVDPREHSRIGSMQYAETLPLEDREVVLTFDDGPIPKFTNQILDQLADDCVKATFFLVGDMAKRSPQTVRRIRDLGHTVGTHSESHPLSMNKMPLSQAKQQIDDGIAAVTAALGEPPAPFFRIPGLLRATEVEGYLAAKGLQTWSADLPADDWKPLTAEQVHALAMARLAARGRGVVLLHDIQPRTVGALPMILRDLKAQGYRIVHVVAAEPGLSASQTVAALWRSHPRVGTAVALRWPAVPAFSFASRETLPVPRRFDLDEKVVGAAGWRMSTQGVPALRGVSVPARDVFARSEDTAPELVASIPLPALGVRVAGAEDTIGALIAETSESTLPGVARRGVPERVAQPPLVLPGLTSAYLRPSLPLTMR